jgi:predicted PurR-regulated permease PerM
VTLYYLLKDGPKIKPWLVKLAPPAYQPEIGRLLDRVDYIWGRFLGIQLLLFVIFALLMLLGTLLVVWLFRSGLLEWSFLGFVALLLAVYTAVQQVDNLWLRPQFLGRQLNLHPGIVFVGLVGALVISGFLGALVVVPLLATIKAIGQYVHHKLLGIPPWPELVVVEEPEPSEDADEVVEG